MKKYLLLSLLLTVVYPNQPGPIIMQQDRSGNVTMINPQSGQMWGGNRDNSGNAYMIPLNQGDIEIRQTPLRKLPGPPKYSD